MLREGGKRLLGRNTQASDRFFVFPTFPFTFLSSISSHIFPVHSTCFLFFFFPVIFFLTYFTLHSPCYYYYYCFLMYSTVHSFLSSFLRLLRYFRCTGSFNKAKQQQHKKRHVRARRAMSEKVFLVIFPLLLYLRLSKRRTVPGDTQHRMLWSACMRLLMEGDSTVISWTRCVVRQGKH